MQYIDSFLEGLMKPLYRLAIRLYQRRISPHKGFRCAYSHTHGGPGCSGAVLSILEDKGLFSGWGLIKERFISCESAAKDREEDRKKRKDKSGSGSDHTSPCGFGAVDACDVGDCIPDGPCDGPCDISTSLKVLARVGLF
jgi:putative component of membrane protein insertase Oxa1/YidC/SpoIIIJ protein YidD